MNSEPLNDVYAAAFWDAEGHVTINKKGEGVSGLLVSVTNTNRPIIDEFTSRFNGGTYTAHAAGRGKRKATWRWTTAGNDALNFLRTIQPYVRLKRRQIDVALTWAAWMKCPERFEIKRAPSIGGGPYHGRMHGHRVRNSYAQAGERWFKRMMNKLNKRGA